MCGAIASHYAISLKDFQTLLVSPGRYFPMELPSEGLDSRPEVLKCFVDLIVGHV